MNISGWTVRTRLTVGFGSVCALMLLMMGIGIVSMGKLHDSTDEIVNDRVPKIDATTTIVVNTNAQATALRDMLLTSEVAYRQKQVELIGQSREVIGKNIELLERLVTDPKGKDLLKEVKAQRTKYIAAQEALMGLIAADKADEAKIFLTTKVRPILSVYQDAISSFAATQVSAMEDSAKADDAIYAGARSLMFGLGVLALAVAAGLGVLITRSLLKDLGGEPSEAADLARAAAQGDFTRSVVVKEGDTQSLMASLSAMQKSLAGVVAAVRMGSESVSTASVEIAQGNNDLSSRTEQQASALEQTAASMEELGATVKQNADSARTANQLAASASAVAIQGGKVVDQVVETMKGINESSRRISDIISVIDGIAFQTNILALNAAVEAARAGEQGRGFAVVASEVRSLAGRSAEAAKEIKTLINASVERVEHGSALVDQAGSTMTEVVDSIRRVTDIMGEISAASNEQASGVAQVGAAVGEMDRVTQQNAALVEEMAAAASSLKSQAQELVQAVAFFRMDGSTGASPLPRAAVRSTRPSDQPFKGDERRLSPPAGAAARKPTAPGASKSASPRPKAAAAPVPPVKTQTKPAPAGGDADWETF